MKRDLCNWPDCISLDQPGVFLNLPAERGRTVSVTCGASLTLMVSQLTLARWRIWPRIITGWVSGSEGDSPTAYFMVAIL